MVPRSAQIEFQLKVSKSAEQDPEFLVLKGECQNDILNFRQLLKRRVIQATDLEARNLLKEVQVHFCESIKIITDAYFAGNDMPENYEHSHESIATIFEHFHQNLIHESLKMTHENFKTIYKTTHQLEMYPTPPTRNTTDGTGPNDQRDEMDEDDRDNDIDLEEDNAGNELVADTTQLSK